MKNEKGVTLISLTVYIIVMALVVGILAIITTFFYKNTIDIKDIDPITEYITFNTFITDEINHSNIKVLECKDNYIVFSNGVQYTFIPANKGIYRNKVKICRGIENCSFETGREDENDVVRVVFKAQGQSKKNITYTLKNSKYM